MKVLNTRCFAFFLQFFPTVSVVYIVSIQESGIGGLNHGLTVIIKKNKDQIR